MAEEKRPVMIRPDPEIYAAFKRIRPERGAVSDFFNDCMEEFVRLWGDRPTPHDLAMDAVRNVYDRTA